MKNNLQDYQNFIKKASEHPTKELRAYHRETLANFQHERLVHLIVTLFFTFITLALIALSFTLYFTIPKGILIYFWPLSVADLILIITTGFYIKHYYTLENGVQILYKYTEKLYKGSEN